MTTPPPNAHPDPTDTRRSGASRNGTASTRVGAALGAWPAVAERRVILVGRTGLDAALRLDPSIELVRARTPLGAIGELSSPIDAASPTPATVIVAADADSGPRAPRFVEALRSVDPGVRIVLAAGAGAVPRPDVYDAVFPSGGGGEALRAAIRPIGGAAPQARTVPTDDGAASPSRRQHADSSSPTSPVTSGTAAPAPAAPPPRSSTTPAAAGPTHQPAVPPPATTDDDLPVLQAVLAGRDILLPALGAIRRRTGLADLLFTPIGPEAKPPEGATAVLYRAQSLGWLSAPHGPASGGAAAGLAPHAEWLAHWLFLRDQQGQLRQSAFTDDLTGAYNRRYFARFLAAAIEQAAPARRAVTLLYFDIDDFKQYNDRYGHDAGDNILRETVRLLKSVIRPTDRVCRIGGDEFTVIFHDPAGPRDPASPAPAPDSIWDLAKRFQRQILEHRFPKLAEQAPGPLTISGGLATFPWDGRTADELLTRADQLALASKRQGKNVITMGPGAERECKAGTT